MNRSLGVSEVRALVRDLAGPITGRPIVLAIDGRGASGKSTLTDVLCTGPAGWEAIATDDIAWWHSFFDWTALAVTGVLSPARAGEPVSFRPPAWDERGRTGAIEVSSKCEVLVLEGTGASRRELSDLLDVAVWVDADDDIITQREAERVRSGHVSVALQDAWQAQERPFLAQDRPWSRAHLIVDGTTISADHVLVTQTLPKEAGQ